MSKEKLENILEKIDIDVLRNLKEYILNSKEYKKLFRCTQMRDEVLRDDNDKTTNRGLHTIQVATNAQKLAKYLLERKNGKEFTEQYEKVLNEKEQKQVLVAEIVGLSHDLGHLPMAHASEVVCGEKNGNNFIFGHDNELLNKNQRKFDEELSKKYSYENIFKNNNISKEENFQEVQTENVQIIEYKEESIFTKIMNKIRNFFTKLKI